VLDRGEQLGHRAAHALRGGIGGHEIGMPGLDGLQLVEERIVLGVRDLGAVQLVVEAVVPLEEGPQLLGAGGGERVGSHTFL